MKPSRRLKNWSKRYTVKDFNIPYTENELIKILSEGVSFYGQGFLLWCKSGRPTFLVQQNAKYPQMPLCYLQIFTISKPADLLYNHL